MPRPARGTFLVISQVYVPDPASVGQHMADAAAEMARRGHRVIAYASARGYDDPSKQYAPRETVEGVDVQRFALSSFGKSSIKVRLLGQMLFLLQCIARGLFIRDLRGILVSTSPPMASIASSVISALRGVPVKFWAMDLNPDQMIAMGMIREGSMPARVFDLLNRRLLRGASDIVALDRFMLERLNRKVEVSAKSEVFPPWPHDDHLERVEHRENPFRREHGLDGKFVVMYSGNHSPANPIATVLDAARALKDDPTVVFMFIGGGLQKQAVEQAIAEGCSNVRSLPYQPIESLRYSLSAADVHVVTVGNEVVGIVHPCKIYGAMAVGRPVLTFGPDRCHLADLVAEHGIGRHVAHGRVDEAVGAIRELAATTEAERRAMGDRAAAVVRDRLSKRVLCSRFADILERGLPGLGSAPPATEDVPAR